MTTQHTPTPWEVSLRNAGAAIIAPAASGKIHEATIICSGLGGHRGNAAFIVRACNAHDELVAALRNSLAFVEYVANNGNEGAHETAVEIRAALAKVQP